MCFTFGRNMKHSVTSRFSIMSPLNIDQDWLSEKFPWPVIEARPPDEKIAHHITVFDLQAGEHDRVDYHLAEVNRRLMEMEDELSTLSEECAFALWINYAFPSDSGAINLPVSIQSAFSFLRTEIILHLKPL